MNRSVGKGATILVISGLICKFFGALFRLPLTNILGMEGIGLFQMVMSLYSLAIVFIAGGVTNSLAKLVSSSRARGEFLEIGGYLKKALVFTLSLAMALGIAFALFSSPIASAQGWKDGSSYLLMIFLLPFGALVGVFRGIIQGYENMTPTAISQIIEQVSKFAFGLIFSFLLGKKSVQAGVFGGFLGITISELLAFLYLLFFMKSRVRVKPNNVDVGRSFYGAVLPLSFGGAVLPLTHAVESLIIVQLLSFAGIESTLAKSLYGLQTGVVGAILNFPLIISLAVAMALLPKIAFLSSKGKVHEERKTINKAFSIMWFFLLPLVLGIISLSKEIFILVYRGVINDFLSLASNLTILGGIGVLLCAIMQFLLSILQAKGLFNFSLVFSLIGGTAKILALVILAPIKEIGIYSIAISNIILYVIVSLCVLIKLGNTIKINLFNVLLPILSGIVMLMSVKILLSALGGMAGITLSVICGGAIYLVLCFPLTRDYAQSVIDKFKSRKKRLQNED